MTSADWKCKTCGGTLIKTSEQYLCCENGCGRLLPAPTAENLLLAEPVNRSRTLWKIGRDWRRYVYVARQHSESLDRCPPEGCIVASVQTKRGLQPRMFIQKPGQPEQK